MRPTIFQLGAFGASRLPPAQTRAVLLHLRRGCARCRAALPPRDGALYLHQRADANPDLRLHSFLS